MGVKICGSKRVKASDGEQSSDDGEENDLENLSKAASDTECKNSAEVKVDQNEYCKGNWLHHCNIFLQTFNFRWLKLGYTYGLTYIGQLKTDLKNTPHCIKVTVLACCSERNGTLICYKCTKHQFIHLLTATCNERHIENSKNHKKVISLTITLPNCQCAVE